MDAKKIVMLTVAILMATSLVAEVELVVLKWNPIPCKNNCPSLLQNRLEKSKGVVSVEMHPEEGRADLKWSPTIPFSFIPLNWALRYVGVREKDLRVRVSGHILGSGSNYSIVSRGDHTIFTLFNRAVPVNHLEYTTLFNSYNRVLSKEITAKLDEVMKGKKIAVIEGPLFMPERSPPDPLRLVIDTLSVEAAPPSSKSH